MEVMKGYGAGGGGLVVQLHLPLSSTLEEGVCSRRLAPQIYRHRRETKTSTQIK